MRVNAVRVFVDDLDVARKFYVDTLGWPVAFEDAEAGYVGLELGVNVIVEKAANGTAALVGRFTGLAVWVDDMEAAQRLFKRRGVKFEGDAGETAWGARVAHFRDPCGNVITLVSDKEA